MSKFQMNNSRWIWLLVVVLLGLISLGVAILPEVLKRDYAAPRTPAGLYILSLITVAMFVGLLVSLAIERFERLMVILFVGFRIGEVTWQYQLDRHSLWYLIISVLTHILVGAFALLFLSGHLDRARLPRLKK